MDPCEPSPRKRVRTTGDDADDTRGSPGSIPTIKLSETTPESFYASFVAKRRPCVIDGHFTPESGWKAHKWTNDYLKATVKGEVQVERRESASASFGQQKEVVMPFTKFLDSLTSDERELYYLSTQDLRGDGEDRPLLTSPPITDLLRAGDLPIRPPLFPTLIPVNINLWMGAGPSSSSVGAGGDAGDGAGAGAGAGAAPATADADDDDDILSKPSSGLHFDFHDNLYILLRGRKHFELYPPTATSMLYPRGKVSQVHPNGLINFEGTTTDPNGVTQEARTAAALAAQLAGDGGGDGEDGDVDSDREDALLLAVLEQEIGDVGDDDDDDAEDEEGGGEEEDEEEDGEDGEERGEDADGREEKRNFSLVNDCPAEEVDAKFPLYNTARKTLRSEVFLRQGQMLYLPTGWFHNVRSTGGAKEGHCAVNYWFAPPSTSDFDAPYSSSYWTDDWRDRGGDAKVLAAELA